MADMKPILFNTEMVKAIMDGRKTMTRRLLKPQPTWSNLNMRWDWGKIAWWRDNWNPADSITEKNMPYKPGDILYVRETWTELFYVDPEGYTHFDQSMYYYAADGTPDITLVDGDGFELDDQRIKWKPSIHMPKELARIFLRVKSVRVEQLQEGFSGDTAIFALRAEGIDIGEHCRTCIDNYGRPCCNDEDTDGGSECGMLDDVLTKFVQLWDSTIPKHPNKFKSYPYYWKDNPWVWVIEFERISKEEALK